MSAAAELREPYLTLFKLVLKYFDDPQTNGLLLLKDFRSIAALGYNSGLIRPGVNWLEENKFLDVVRDSQGSIGGWTFSEKGAEAGYQLIISSEHNAPNEEYANISDESFGNPDAFLNLRERPDELEKAIASLDILKEAVRSDNSLFARNEDRLALISEVESFRNTISTGSIRVATALSIIRERGTLRWLADKAAGGIVGKSATSTITLLLQLFGLS